jgi:hypothetical protein
VDTNHRNKQLLRGFMDANFWHQKWQTNDIGFHQPEGNPLLVAHFNALGLAPGSRIFYLYAAKHAILLGCWRRVIRCWGRN